MDSKRRIRSAGTLEEVLAVIARWLPVQMAEDHKCNGGIGPVAPDYADFRDAFKPYIRRGMILARLEETKRTPPSPRTVVRVLELTKELAEVEVQIRKELDR